MESVMELNLEKPRGAAKEILQAALQLNGKIFTSRLAQNTYLTVHAGNSQMGDEKDLDSIDKYPRALGWLYVYGYVTHQGTRTMFDTKVEYLLTEHGFDAAREP